MNVYLDTNILIYLVEGDDRFRHQVQEALRTDANLVCHASDLVRLECLVEPVRRNDSERIAAYEEQFKGLTMLPMPREVFDIATGIRAEFGTKTPDALHVAAALHAGCAEFWTGDRRLTPVKERIALRVFDEAAT